MAQQLWMVPSPCTAAGTCMALQLLMCMAPQLLMVPSSYTAAGISLYTAAETCIAQKLLMVIALYGSNIYGAAAIDGAIALCCGGDMYRATNRKVDEDVCGH